jgi:hypothetical protein
VNGVWKLSGFTDDIKGGWNAVKLVGLKLVPALWHVDSGGT